MKRKEGAVIYWAPRVLSITLIIFLVFFSFDVFGNGLGFWQTLAAFLMHNIPAILLTALLITAWKREIVGAVTFFTAGLLYVTFVISAIIREGFEWHYLAWIALCLHSWRVHCSLSAGAGREPSNSFKRRQANKNISAALRWNTLNKTFAGTKAIQKAL